MQLILEVLGSGGFGALLGALFGWLNKREERASVQMRLDHQRLMVEAKTNAQLKLAEAGIKEATVQGELAERLVEAEAFKASQKTSAFGRSAKALIRPTIVAVLMYQVYLILSSLEKITGGLKNLPVSDVVSLYKIVILMITGLTATAVGWYFSQRSSKQFDKLLEKWG